MLKQQDYGAPYMYIVQTTHVETTDYEAPYMYKQHMLKQQDYEAPNMYCMYSTGNAG